MNHVSKRLLVGLSLWLVVVAHPALVGDVSNTPGGMMIYHGVALLFDYATLVVCSFMLDGQLRDDMQTLCLASMIVNFIGWILYLAYAPPVFYDCAIGVLGYVQWIRLFLGDHDAYRMGRDLVHRRDSVGPKLHSKEANQ